MPLSEHEQRILIEIEHQLRATDPDLARQVGQTTVYSVPRRRARLAILGMIVGLAITIALLTVNAWAAFIIGFGLMFGSALVLEQSVRHLAAVGIDQLAASVKRASVRDLFGLQSPDDPDSAATSSDEPF